MSKHRSGDYAFGCSVIRSNEKNLLSKADLTRVLEAKDMQAAMTILGEFGYGDSKDMTASAQRPFEEILRKEQERANDLCLSVAPDKRELNLFYLPIDYHNAKTILKAEFLETDPNPYLMDGGTVTKEKLMEYIRERNFTFMDGGLKEALPPLIESFAKVKDPQEIDLALDKACYKEMADLAKETDRKFLIDYVKLLVDLTNVVTFVRLRQIGKPWTFFQKVFLEGGSINEREFTTNYEDDYQQFAEKLFSYGFDQIFSRGAEQVEKEGKYWLLEKLCDDARIEYMKKARFITLGVEPILAYMVAKEMENKNLRIILAAKQAGVEATSIAERLRETYA